MDQENQNNKKANAEFFRLFMVNQKSIYAFVLSLVHNINDADDIMQETVALMWERFEEFEPGSNFGAWGVTIARFKVLKFLNKKKHQHDYLGDELIEQLSGVMEKKVDQMTDMQDALQHCLDKLKLQDRKLIRIRYEQNLSIRSIALSIGRPIEGMYKAMARIHQALHRCVKMTMTAWGSYD